MSTHRFPYRSRYPTAFESLLPWSPVLVGLGVVIGFLIWILVLPIGQPPPFTAPQDVGKVQPSAEPTPALASASATPSASPDPTEPPDATEPPPEVLGEYGLVSRFEQEFIGSVVVVNSSGDPQDWQVRLAYPSDVGDLKAAWVEGQPNPAVQRQGDQFAIAGAVPVDGESTLILNLQFERSGPDIDPTTCTVNGAACT